MIGVFDSGLGGLWALRALHECLPNEDLVYFGDTARLPYGDRSVRTIRRFARQDLQFLQQFSPRAVLAACGTVSSVALPLLQVESATPVYGVVEPTAREAVRKSKSGRIGVIATTATVTSGAYQEAICRLCPTAQVFCAACPLFVSLIESGLADRGDLVDAVCRQYLTPFLAWEIDTLVLGCTHYPLLSRAIAQVLPHTVQIDAGKQAALALCEALAEGENVCEQGQIRFCVSEDPQGFSARSATFLGYCANPVFLV